MKPIPKGYFALICFEKKSKTYGVHFPDHPGIITYGKTPEEAAERAEEALAAALESDFDRAVPLPTSHKPRMKDGEKAVFVPIAPEIKTAYLLRQWREEAGLSQRQLAARLEISFQAYQRMERPGRANLTVATLERIAAAMSKRLVLDLCDATA